MIALIGGLLAVALAWWIIRRLIVLVLLVAVMALAAAWLTHVRSPVRRVPGAAQLGGIQHEITHDLSGALRRDGVRDRHRS